MFHTVTFAKYFQNGKKYLNSLFLFGKKQIKKANKILEDHIVNVRVRLATIEIFQHA